MSRGLQMQVARVRPEPARSGQLHSRMIRSRFRQRICLATTAVSCIVDKIYRDLYGRIAGNYS